MPARLLPLLGRLGRLQQLFLLLLPLYLAARYLAPASPVETLLSLALFFTGAALLYRLARAGMRKFIWRLRNRLLVAYTVIGVVPVVLILALIGFGAWILTGQIAMYLVTTELDRHAHALLGPAQARIRSIPPHYRQRFPGLQLLSGDAAPPQGWGESSGLLSKAGAFYIWANSAGTALLAPLSRDALTQLVPGLGEVAFMQEATAAKKGRKTQVGVVFRGKRFLMPESAPGERDPLPPPVLWLDHEVTYLSAVPVAIWESPGLSENRLLIVRTRYSAVLRTIFGQTVEFTEGFTMATLATLAFMTIASLFLLFELVSLVIGIRLTRTITGAVHNLYEGTQKVQVGDFSHRIEVSGGDQLAELSHSFNRMTENLERLLQVAKEKERLQSELEIAREVQNQLFPRATPEARTLELAAVCRPARMVSGDYYDYLSLPEPRLALAIGDVAGKGISAALLMATVQSSMRTQLRACATVSTAALVSRLNQQLHAYTPPEKFATFYFAVYDDSTGLLTYTNAGHVPPLLFRDGQPLRLDVNGMIVGAFPFAEYEETSLQLEPGDLLVCFTDGITEPENEYGEMFGEDRLIEVVARNAARPTQEIIDAVMDAVGHWTGSPELQDDMTMLLARRS